MTTLKQQAEALAVELLEAASAIPYEGTKQLAEANYTITRLEGCCENYSRQVASQEASRLQSEKERDEVRREVESLKDGSLVKSLIKELGVRKDTSERCDQLTSDNQQLRARVVELELLIDNYLADGRPHGGKNTQFPDGCECDICQSWDTLCKQRNQIKDTPSNSLLRQQELERYKKALEWLEANLGAYLPREAYSTSGFDWKWNVGSQSLLEAIEQAMKGQQ